MKKVVTIMVLTLFCASMAFAGSSWTGYVTDAKCAPTKAGEDHAGCAKNCIKGGEKAVLADGMGKIWKIADSEQSKVLPHAGHKVKINGSGSGEMIDSIENVEHISGS